MRILGELFKSGEALLDALKGSEEKLIRLTQLRQLLEKHNDELLLRELVTYSMLT